MASPQRLKGILTVTVLKANNLISSDWFSQNDCYTVVSLKPFSNKEQMKAKKKKDQTEIYQMTQIHGGSNPIFNEKLIFPVAEEFDTLYVQLWDEDFGKDDFLAHGKLSLLEDEQGQRFNTATDQEWLDTVTIPLINKKDTDGGTLEVVLHFIPETVATYIAKKFDAAQADAKKKLTQQIVAKVTDIATDKIRGYAGIEM